MLLHCTFSVMSCPYNPADWSGSIYEATSIVLHYGKQLFWSRRVVTFMMIFS